MNRNEMLDEVLAGFGYTIHDLSRIPAWELDEIVSVYLRRANKEEK